MKKEKFDNEGYVVKRKVIDDETINKSRLAIDKIRKNVKIMSIYTIESSQISH